MPLTTASEARRIGTAPFKPAQVTNSRSLRSSFDGSRSGVTTSGRIDEAEQHGENEPLPPDVSREDEAEVDREPEGDEDGELAEVGERREEVPHLDSAGKLRVADHDPCHEDGQEARAVPDGGDRRR